eukprot:TRINITY_DN11426_c0_g1_i1.p1 TRINITY_DN11426_c0_g1~~TRINITY_DN11426_c0_g1_i1.p1  ORF type:complete len:323 (+),score=93.98 TRINITY_DN11426_c0_g1_i1:64-969(+)
MCIRDRAYQKRCMINSVPVLAQLKAKFEDDEEGGDIEALHVWEEAGAIGVRAIMEAMIEIKYQHTKSIRFWKAKAQDEGVRATCQFLETNKTVRVLEFMDCEVGVLGAEFIGRVLEPSIDSAITVLKLDHNPLGTAGLAMLARGLCRNSKIQSLSLTFCGIDSDGSKYLQQILAFINSDLKELYLQGNHLKNAGVFQLFRVLEINQVLTMLDISDNQFGEEEKLMEKICDVIVKNQTLKSYNFKFNGIFEDGTKKIIEAIKQSKVEDVKLNDTLAKEVQAELEEAIARNKPKRKPAKKKAK